MAEIETARQKLQAILRSCIDKGIDAKLVPQVQKFLHQNKIAVAGKHASTVKWFFMMGVAIYCLQFYFNNLQSKRCLFELPPTLRYAFRPPENCDFCQNIDRVPRVRGITSAEFAAKYAYTGAPLIVEDATRNWTALTKFSYNYFHDVYQNSKRKHKILDCQFLPYKTGFRNIFDALDMPQQRIELKRGTQPWYFGWSNCNPETAEEFRRHYGRPYFLPRTSENNAVDWFFIGTAGLGAHMHIDNVRLPSWQAQLSGSKRWILAPPPECYFKCKQFDAIVNKGDIIVLDTNKWYHQTFVQPGQISLTIGAEYD